MLFEMANPNLKSDCRRGPYACRYCRFKTLDKKAQILSDFLVLLGAFEHFLAFLDKIEKPIIFPRVLPAPVIGL